MTVCLISPRDVFTEESLALTVWLISSKDIFTEESLALTVWLISPRDVFTEESLALTVCLISPTDSFAGDHFIIDSLVDISGIKMSFGRISCSPETPSIMILLSYVIILC